MKHLLDFYQQVGDAERERPRQVDQDKGVHARQQHAAQTGDHAAQAADGRRLGLRSSITVISGQ